MSQIELKFDSEQNAFGLTEDFDDLYSKRSIGGTLVDLPIFLDN